MGGRHVERPGQRVPKTSKGAQATDQAIAVDLDDVDARLLGAHGAGAHLVDDSLRKGTGTFLRGAGLRLGKPRPGAPPDARGREASEKCLSPI